MNKATEVCREVAEELKQTLECSDTEFLNEFEQLNSKTNTIYDLEEYEVLIILNDGTNLTSWDDVEDKDDILYVSEDLTDVEDLKGQVKKLVR